MTQPPRPLAPGGDVAERKTDSLADADTRTVPAADYPPPEQKYGAKHQEKGYSAWRVQIRKYRLGAEEAGLGFEKRKRPRNQPP